MPSIDGKESRIEASLQQYNPSRNKCPHGHNASARVSPAEEPPYFGKGIQAQKDQSYFR